MLMVGDIDHEASDCHVYVKRDNSKTAVPEDARYNSTVTSTESTTLIVKWSRKKAGT